MNAKLALGFSGMYQDPVTGSYPLGNGYRFYLPGLMRFCAPDGWSPFGGSGIHPYGYCGEDPVNHTDPTGHVGIADFIDEVVTLAVEEGEKEAAASIAAREAQQAGQLAAVSETGRAPASTGIGPSTSRGMTGEPDSKRLRLAEELSLSRPGSPDGSGEPEFASRPDRLFLGLNPLEPENEDILTRDQVTEELERIQSGVNQVRERIVARQRSYVQGEIHPAGPSDAMDLIDNSWSNYRMIGDLIERVEATNAGEFDDILVRARRLQQFVLEGANYGSDMHRELERGNLN